MLRIRPSKDVLKTSVGTRRRTFRVDGKSHTLEFGKDPVYLDLAEVPVELKVDPHLVITVVTEEQMIQAGGTVTPLAGESPATASDVAPIGPNVRRLISHRLAGFAIPEGGGASNALAFLSKLDQDVVRGAVEWVQAAIAAVKTAPDNSFGDDDEAIAGEILRRLAGASEPAIPAESPTPTTPSPVPEASPAPPAPATPRKGKK